MPGLLLKRVQYVNRSRQPHRVNRTKGVAVIIGDDLQDSGPKTSQRLRVHVLVTHLRLIKSKPDLPSDRFRKFHDPAPRIGQKDERSHPLSLVCHNWHIRQVKTELQDRVVGES